MLNLAPESYKVICSYLVLKNIKVDDDINIYLSCEA